MHERAGLLDQAPAMLDTARAAYGRGTAVWAHRDEVIEPTWWLALSGTGCVDYNQALLYGEDAREVLPEILERIQAVNQPSTIALAGAALESAQDLANAGWVCVGTLPFMYRAARPGAVNARARSLEPDDLPRARDVLSTTFDVPEDSAEAVFRASLLERAEVRTWGLFDPDLVSIAVTVGVADDLYVGWALATAPGHQHRGYGASLLRHIDEWYFRNGGLGSLHVATSSSARLYAARDHLTLEHWQIWSRPRWLLGRS